MAAREAKDLKSRYEHLGNAIHTLQDATSPSHRGMQQWIWINPVVGAMGAVSGVALAFVQPVAGIAVVVAVAIPYVLDLIHVLREPSYPKAGSPEAKQLEGVTRNAERIVSNRDGPVPEVFIDEQGYLKREIYEE